MFVFRGHPVPSLVCIAFYFSLGSEDEPTAAPPQYTTKQQTRLCGSARLGGSLTSPKSSKSSLSQFAGIALISGESLRSVKNRTTRNGSPVIFNPQICQGVCVLV